MKLIVLIFLSLASFQSTFFAKAYVTYLVIADAGLGDQLIGYSIAKKIALDHNLTFLYQPFNHSDQLVLSTTDQTIPDQLIKNSKLVSIGYSLDRSNEDKDN